MYELLSCPGRTFTLEELVDHAQAVRGSVFHSQAKALSIPDINLNPVVDPDELEFLAGLVPFHRVPTRISFLKLKPLPL